ncbi:hypothetical protein [Limnobacter sp.]|uniref:hypothetical protein n=1 Tax=Limnobacter sp. TaxID=2003368 RepID=UPI00391C2539
MTEKREVRLSILSIWVGILIPILAAVIPFLIQELSPEQELQFSVVGPVSVNRAEAVEIEMKNNGSKPARGVQVWLKSSPYATAPDLLAARGTRKDPVELIEVASKTPIKKKVNGEFFVIEVGDLRSKESLSVSVLSRDGALSIYGTKSHVSGIEVKSDENVGSYEGDSIFEEFLYPFGFWMFVALMVLILVAALHQEYFMDSKTREKMILKEIEKLERARSN